MKRKSLIVFITHILAFLCVCSILGCSVESSSGEEKTKYTVSYSSDYATEQVYKLKPVTVQEGTVLGVEQLPVLSENGYTFIGWYDGETKVVAGAYKVTKNVTLVAKWNKKATQDDDSKKTSYTISYFSDKGVTDTSLLNPITLSGGTAITAEQLPELSADGWSFEGWYDGETKVVAGTYKVTKSVLFVAKWSKIGQTEEPEVITYTVSYFSDKGVTDGALLNPITVLEGTVIIAELLPELSADGWNFEGWYDGEIRVVAGTYKVTKNVLFIAKWNKKATQDDDSKKTSYTVSYSSDKGVTDASLLNSITVLEGTAISAEQLPELSADGWSFEGWYDGEAKVVAGYKVTKNITLVAKWTLNPKYTVEHWLQNLDNDEYVRKEVDSQQLYGKAGDITNATAKNYPGFTAQEIEQRVIQPDGTTVVNIKYDRKIITVTVNLDGGNINGNENNIIVKGKFGKATGLSVNDPNKTDCKFGGWSTDIPKIFPADDIEIKALWGNIYSVEYQTEKDTDATPTSIRVLENTVLSAEKLPELKEIGWIFEGWYDGETKAISEEYAVIKNVTLVAKWSPATVAYTVEHCQQNIEDDKYTFLVVTEKLYGKTEELTAAVAKDYPGFTAQNITQTKIAADGSTVVKVYYDRKIINLTFNLDGGNIDGNTEDVVISGKYGANVSVPGPVKVDCKFVGWDKTVPQTFPAENDIFVAQWKGTASITINLFDWDSDLKIIKETEHIYNIVVPVSYTDISWNISSYDRTWDSSWEINKQRSDATSCVYNLKIPEKVGCYNLFIKAKKNGLWHSYSLNAVVSISED